MNGVKAKKHDPVKYSIFLHKKSGRWTAVGSKTWFLSKSEMFHERTGLMA